MTTSPPVTKPRAMIGSIYGLVRPYGRRRLVAVLLISSIQAIAQLFSVALVFPFLALATDPTAFMQSPTGQFLDMWIPGFTDTDLLVSAGSVLVVGLLLASLASLYGEYYRARFTWNFSHWLRVQMLGRITAHSYSWFTRQNSSVLIKKISQDINQFAVSVLSPIIDGVSRILTSFLLILGILIVEPTLAIIIAGTMAVYYLVIFLWLRKFRDHISDSLKTAWRGIYLHVTQLLTGIKVAKVQGVEAEMVHRVIGHSHDQARLLGILPIINNGPRYLLEPLIALVIVGFVLVSLSDGAQFTTMLPSLGFVALAGYRLLPALQMLYAYSSGISTMRYTLEEVYDEFRAIEEPHTYTTLPSSDLADHSTGPTTQQPSAAITLEHVRFTYPGTDHLVLEDVSIIIPRNTSVAIVGESGSGKSTLVDIILGLHRPTRGHVLIDNTPISTISEIRRWQDQVGYVPQDIFLTDDTITRNIAFGVPDTEIDEQRITEVARMAQIAKFIENQLPDGYSTNVGERGVQLSGGQRQRIALARALYHRPRILILDEATSALDDETEARFMSIVFELSHQLTIIMVAHRLSTIDRCETVYRLRDAKLVNTITEPAAK